MLHLGKPRRRAPQDTGHFHIGFNSRTSRRPSQWKAAGVPFEPGARGRLDQGWCNDRETENRNSGRQGSERADLQQARAFLPARECNRRRMMAREPFDLADVDRREATIGAGTGPFSRAPLPRSAAPPASTSPRYGTSRIRKHDTDSFHPCRRCAPAASSSCMLGTSANEQLTYNPRFTDVAASDRRCRCRSAHPSTRRSPNAVPLVH
jgi:hypothetical protein